MRQLVRSSIAIMLTCVALIQPMPHLAYDDNQIPENQTSFINPYEQDEQQTESEMEIW